MTLQKPSKSLQYMLIVLGALVVVWIFTTFGAHRPGPSIQRISPAPAGGPVRPPVSTPAQTPAPQPAETGQAGPGSPSTGATGSPAPSINSELPTSPVPGTNSKGGKVSQPVSAGAGRHDPFVPLVVVESDLPTTPSSPGGPPAPAPGNVGLPLPPGVAPGGAPGGGSPGEVPGMAAPGKAAPALGAGMIVRGVIGRFAIIESRVNAKSYVVTVGDTVGDAVVIDVRADKVVLQEGGTMFELPIGGQNPS
jgi:hypothetical protein